MKAKPLLVLRNPGAAPIADLPMLGPEQFRSALLGELASGSRLCALFGMEPSRARRPEGEPLVLVAAAARDAAGEIALFGTEVAGSYAAFTPACPQADWFERELHEQWGIRPEGHPWLKPVRFEPSRRERRAGDPSGGRRIGVTDFFRVEGEEVHEVAVGPVHAGVIEPGHFRFQCHGETVYHLEISLGYQHRGVERALEGGPDSRSLHLAETLAGDTTIGHGAAYCQAVEALSGLTVSLRAARLRALALELERLANHIGDLGALAGDVGFLPTSSYCGRIRGDVLNMTALLCGNRFGRALLCPGGALFDVEPVSCAELGRRLDGVLRDARSACGLIWKTPAVVARFEGTGLVSREVATQIGLVGPAARASGLAPDARARHGTGWYQERGVEPARESGGDVLARARIRWLEVEASAAMVRQLLDEIGAEARTEGQALGIGRLEPRSIAVSLVEGWRGEICHVAVTDRSGRFARYKIVDPSFHNWFGLACAMRGQQISDFPLCNKSFNLSYCGHDL